MIFGWEGKKGSGGGVGAYLSLSLSLRRSEAGWGWALILCWALINFSAFRMGAYSRWALIRGWALIRINTVHRFQLVSFSNVRACLRGGGGPQVDEVTLFGGVTRLSI